MARGGARLRLQPHGADTISNSGETFLWIGFKQTGSDPVVWLFCLIAHLHLAANGFKNFFPSVIKTLDLGDTITLVMTYPPYLIAGAVTILVSWSSGTYGVNSLILGLCGSVYGQTKEKNTVAISITKASEPHYIPAISASCAFSLGTAAIAWIVKIIMKKRNEKLRAGEDEQQNFYVC
ncbi:uncharacterized protein B0I36DRAFT_350565 [Microdochium trichocladiopsis]|uniref:Uncharacterized protein n=1 Tax=Microdochium trichocladiopsis TaxID=1682393 RepID=A0A9P8Y3C2_9PEZI|nr:uncharacterized protein B0I36DRAFT_350565 [Microdochium trichocladiopsis]KAH7029744.1 hypothetical protein B0I36DRAFT_350565 [Microdochium trichocladiopsis]